MQLYKSGDLSWISSLQYYYARVFMKPSYHAHPELCIQRKEVRLNNRLQQLGTSQDNVAYCGVVATSHKAATDTSVPSTATELCNNVREDGSILYPYLAW
jgi:hypothetical protein